MTVLNMITCFGCHRYYPLTSVNLSTYLKNRLTKYICHLCYEKTGEKSTWDGVSSTRKDTDYFEINRVHQHKITKRGRLFLVSWAGFPEEHNSWLPEKALDGAIEALDEYLLRQGLPPTKIRRRLGIDPVNTPGDKTNWNTIENVLSLVEKHRKGKRHLDSKITILNRIPKPDQLIQDKLMAIVDICAHAYVLLFNPPTLTVWVADGTNSCHREDIKRHITRLIPADYTLRTLSFCHQLGVDDCTSSATLISLELLKNKYSVAPPASITTNPYRRAQIRTSLHIGKPYPLKPALHLHQLKIPTTCQFCHKTFRGRTAIRKAHAHSLSCRPL